MLESDSITQNCQDSSYVNTKILQAIMSAVALFKMIEEKFNTNANTLKRNRNTKAAIDGKFKYFHGSRAF